MAPSEFVMGEESLSITELTPFGPDNGNQEEVFEEASAPSVPMLKEAARLMGNYFDIPLRNGLPKPCRSRSAVVEWRAPQLPTHRARRPERFWRAKASQFVTPTPRISWVTPIRMRLKNG